LYLQANNLSKSFRAPAGAAREILRGAGFQAEAGESIALTGASGAGKSTLLHLLAGLERPDGGEIRVGGFSVTDADAASLAAWRAREAGLVFQAHHLLPDLDAGENVALPLLIQRMPRREAAQKANATLAQVGLAAQARQNVGQLSGGEQQRVALARAIVTGPRLLLADEPTGQLDDATGRQIVELMLDFTRKHNACLILATHNEKWAGLCQRRWEIAAGRLAERA
jgi:lipoprotein-releasing system ATP-binding protein